MTSWSGVAAAAPELAAKIRDRFETYGLGFLATLRQDGAPRLSGIEPLFAIDELWLGMMPGSRKLTDLRRDPRLALHSATVDKDVQAGDAKIAGRAVAVEDDATFQAYRASLLAGGGRAPEGTFPLFRIDVSEVSFLVPDGDHLVIEWWREGTAPQRIERY